MRAQQGGPNATGTPCSPRPCSQRLPSHRAVPREYVPIPGVAAGRPSPVGSPSVVCGGPPSTGSSARSMGPAQLVSIPKLAPTTLRPVARPAGPPGRPMSCAPSPRNDGAQMMEEFFRLTGRGGQVAPISRFMSRRAWGRATKRAGHVRKVFRRSVPALALTSRGVQEWPNFQLEAGARLLREGRGLGPRGRREDRRHRPIRLTSE